MKRLLLIIAVVLPFTVVAQQIDSGRVQDEPGLRGSLRENTSSTRAVGDVFGAPAASTTALSASGLEADAPPQASPQSTKPEEPSKPPIECCGMVGYIDSAIVGSQIRIRFDTAFHNNAPDRAEFFYAQYAGITGPGPNSVVADLNFQQLYLHGEYAPTKRFSFFTEVPVRWIQPQLTVANTTSSATCAQSVTTCLLNVNEAGLSDIAAGFKLAAVASSNQYLTFQFKAYFPSGNASKGLGTNHYSIEAALLYYQRLSDRLALEAQVGNSHPIGGSSCLQTDPPPNTAPCVADGTAAASRGFAGDVFFYGLGPSYVLYRSENVQIAPVVELVGWRVLGGLETICTPSVLNCSGQDGVRADSTNIVNLKVGLRTSIGRHNSFYVGFGQAVTHSVWYEHIVRVEYRYSF